MSHIYLNPFKIFTPGLVEIIRMQRKEELAISKKLAEHQTLEEWQYREAAKIVHEWATSMNDFFFHDELSIPSISFKKSRENNLGHYHFGINAFGLEHELNLNTLHLGGPSDEVASTLIHELTHMYCKLNGLEKPGPATTTTRILVNFINFSLILKLWN